MALGAGHYPEKPDPTPDMLEREEQYNTLMNLAEQFDLMALYLIYEEHEWGTEAIDDYENEPNDDTAEELASDIRMRAEQLREGIE